jgi:flagellar biosynthesis component FlhA
MQVPPDTLEQARARYAIWERSAGITLLVLGTCFLASLAVRVPGIPFVALSVVAGLLMFVAWRLSLANKSAPALATCLGALVAALLALSQELPAPVEVLLPQGLSLVALALFAGIFAYRRRQT